MPAATGSARLNTPRGAVDMLAVVYLWGDNQLYRMLFLAPSQIFSTYEKAFRYTMFSFRQLSDAEAASLKPLRLMITRASTGYTVEMLSKPLPYGDLSADWFRMLNDLPMDRPIPEDKILKLVSQ